MAAKNNDWMGMMEEWFGKLPSLPKGGREAIVTITPWIALIFGVLGVLAGLAGLGLLTALSPFAAMGGGIGTTTWSWASALVGIVASALLLASFPGTKARKKKGWMMLLYSELVSTLAAVVSLSVGGVLVSLIGLYLVFQIKSYYK